MLGNTTMFIQQDKIKSNYLLLSTDRAYKSQLNLTSVSGGGGGDNMPHLGSFIIAHDTMHMQYTRLELFQYMYYIRRALVYFSHPKKGGIIQTLSVQSSFLNKLHVYLCMRLSFWIVLFRCFTTASSTYLAVFLPFCSFILVQTWLVTSLSLTSAISTSLLSSSSSSLLRGLMTASDLILICGVMPFLSLCLKVPSEVSRK